mgnify:CR=1 FL=1
MIYPDNFEDKIGFSEIRDLLKAKCLCSLGRENIDKLSFSDNADTINERLKQIKEFRRLQTEADDFPLRYFFDMRQSVARVRLEGTHLDEDELFNLRRSLETVSDIVTFLRRGDGDEGFVYPSLCRLTDGVSTFPNIISRIDGLLDKFGKVRDNASPELAAIRNDMAKTAGSISRTLNAILRSAQTDGLVDKDVTPTLRDGRLVIPIAPGLKRRIKGIVHDESASGKTVFVEPTEAVEANNRIRELEAEERREIIRLLTEISNIIRPHVSEILSSYSFLAVIDEIRAKSIFADSIRAIEPTVQDSPLMDYIEARHPLLQLSLLKQGKKVVPLDIMLTTQKHILIISGPNAGGKSVCLKTVGLIQYMLQCGLSVPMSERSKAGVFKSIMIDIGDEQSIENDLSTYSSHLKNMKNMMRYSNERTLLLIDEFGTGTEPQIGGALAEAVLKKLCAKHAFGVITTHYQNLKHFADCHEGIVNGAMLYDRHEMRPLFQLAIGQPGSSFAIDIARKIGLPEDVIKDASDIVGTDYIQSDKYLQDIVRDKRYWESKRQNVHQREKDLEKAIARYEAEIGDVERQRKEIITKAKEEAAELLRQSNKNIENAIREIRECQAEKEETKRIRQQLNAFKADVDEVDHKSNDEFIAKKMRQIQERKERREKRKRDKEKERQNQPAATSGQKMQRKGGADPILIGDTVRIKGLTSVGTVESVDGKNCTVIFGDMRTKMPVNRLEHATAPVKKEAASAINVSRETRETIDSRKLNFHQDLDVRGMRGDEAINAVTYFIDDAILVGMSRVRILHGKGNGILRQLIRQYLATVPNVTSFRDENVQFGGAGITVVDL